MSARIVQHEIDHLDGVLYTDHMLPEHVLVELDAYLKIRPYTKAQNVAKDVMVKLLNFIEVGVSEADIALEARRLLGDAGINEFWYHNLLVLVGERTTLSMSGKDYRPCPNTKVKKNDLVTIDLSPSVDGYWGDLFCSIYVEDGQAGFVPQTSVFRNGYATQEKLHQIMMEIADPDMTAHDLWQTMNKVIDDEGFENLDFLNNLGHSIEGDMSKRRYIEEGNQTSLGGLGLFTFEPHIREKVEQWGYKHENIYFFANGRLHPL